MASSGQLVSTARARLSEVWATTKRRWLWVGHVVAGYRHYKDRHGDHLAAAITYFSFLALFPLVLLGVSVAGFVLSHDQHLLTKLTNSISDNVPGSFGDTLQTVVKTAVSNRAGVGVIGLVGVALAGLGWVANLRTAIDVVWGIASKKRNFIQAKVSDAVVLTGLGLGVVLSLGLTVVGTAATDSILSALNLDGATGVGTLTRVVGILIAVLGDMIVFGWVIVRLPDVSVESRLALRTAALAAIGFEILKVIGTIYIARISKSPTAGIFGSVLGVLIWIDLVARFLLFCVAWAAVAQPAPQRAGPDGESEGVLSEASVAPAWSPARVAVGLLAAGAALGAAGFSALQRRAAARRQR